MKIKNISNKRLTVLSETLLMPELVTLNSFLSKYGGQVENLKWECFSTIFITDLYSAAESTKVFYEQFFKIRYRWHPIRV